MKHRKNMMGRYLTQTIKASLGRYLAIIAIIALGAGIFSGLRVTKVDMVATVQRYTDAQNMFDVQVMNSYGWTDRDVTALSQISGIDDAEGSITTDVLLHMGDHKDQAYKLLSLPETVNRPELIDGRMPSSPDECVVDGYFFPKSVIGGTLYVSEYNTEATLDALACDSYTIVGLVSSPLYLNMQRGSTSIGNGALMAYGYILPEGFAQEVYTQVNLTLTGSYSVYTDRYDDAMDRMAQRLEEDCRPLADRRYEEVLLQAEEEYADGQKEYLDGLREFQEKRAEALDELSKAEQKLLDGEREIQDNRKLLEDGLKQIADGEITIAESRTALIEARLSLAATRSETYAQLAEASNTLMANYKEALTGQQQVEAGLLQIDAGILQLESGLQQLEQGLSLIEIMLPIVQAAQEAAQSALDSAFAIHAPESTIRELEENLSEITAQVEEYTTQREELLTTRAEVQAQYDAVLLQREELLATQAQLEEGLLQLELGFRELDQAQRNADNQFAAAEAQLDAGQLQLENGAMELAARKQEAEDGLVQLEAAEIELAEGKETFAAEKEKALQELSDAEAELQDAEAKLADGRKAIDDMESPDIFALTRNTNLGYVVFESDSDIVAGVAKIFPVFFLAVAALVCITTMTRMIDEERTQIGVLKALGYSSTAIMGKYLGYSGSASFLGCICGLLLGCFLFPQVIWFAYCIMYNFSPHLSLSYDLPTFCFIFVSYMGLTLLVTWYCCRRELQEVPAQLIRPKAPTAGKALFFENLALWNSVKFLDKVAIRNIFRYRQRLAMMLLGIGGCTALLVTGFGLKDSISGITDSQFSTITLYDIAATFSGPVAEEQQEEFRRTFRGKADQCLFVEQGGIDVEFGGGLKNINFLATDHDLAGFIDLHKGETPISMPGKGEAVLSVGVCRAMGIRVGDKILLRNDQMEQLHLTVSGIYDNHVYNYAIVSGETLRDQWDRAPEEQSVFLLASPNQDVHALGASVAGFDDVLNVTVNLSTANQVGGMLDALDAVIVLIVVCAGLLAGIVLYNLTNINIKERIREIATIKVLGFNAAETGSYVFKENLALTVMGTILGLFAGKLLHATVMSYVRIDMVWFGNHIAWQSYLVSAILTLVCAIAVDALMYFQLEKINMAEALKSVE